MYGGVAGHAGLFSNATDVAQLMQMLLNNGMYNGKQFLKKGTIDLFTKQNDLRSRRGLGFDKPEPDQSKRNTTYDHVPLSVFGHSGFTGTSVWSDPENNLTFIFLSNRIHPNAENNKLVKMGIRSSLQRVIYAALEKSKMSAAK
jgi:CubicO group peptidase (beta-lactamase class C family)